jgi:hypothetical protein
VLPGFSNGWDLENPLAFTPSPLPLLTGFQVIAPENFLKLNTHIGELYGISGRNFNTSVKHIFAQQLL